MECKIITVLHIRTCTFCNNDNGDEYHYLLVCKKFDEHRTQLIKPYYYKRPNILKYHDLMNTSNRKQLKDLCHFIKHIMSNVSQWKADLLKSLSHVVFFLLHAKDKGTDWSARLQTQPVPLLFAPCRDKWSNLTYLKFTVWVNLCGWSWSFRPCSVTSHKGRFLVQKSRDIPTAFSYTYSFHRNQPQAQIYIVFFR